ncbi:hypothetical protein LQW54_013170 [Pestalotiopsis sp. IQ-011]
MADDNTTTTTSGGTQTDDNIANVAMPATPLARRPPNPDITPRRVISAAELQQMTAWECVSQVGGYSDVLRYYVESNSFDIAKFKDRYQTLCSAPARRELKTSKHNRVPNLKKMDFNLVGMLIYVAGVPAPDSCCNTPEGAKDECQAMWDGCYVVPEGPMQDETHHACANCFYNGNQTRCRFYLDPRVDAFKEDLARGRHEDNDDDDDDDDGQDKKRKKRKRDGEYMPRAVRQQVDTPRRTGLRSQGPAPAV